MTDIRAALKTLTLSVAHREGWRGPRVRVTTARKVHRFTIHIQFSGDPGAVYDVHGVLGRAFDDLRARQSPEVQAQWPEIGVNPFIMLGATSTGAFTVTID